MSCGPMQTVGIHIDADILEYKKGLSLGLPNTQKMSRIVHEQLCCTP